MKGRVANLALLKPDFEILAFINASQTNLAFFQYKGFDAGKTYSELHYSLQIASDKSL